MPANEARAAGSPIDDTAAGPGARSDGSATGPVPAADVVAARVLAGPARLGPVRLVCVDGPAGSGKTTFAAALASALAVTGGAAPPPGGDGPALPGGAVPPTRGGRSMPPSSAQGLVRPRVAVLHLDDLYEGWSGLAGSLWPRLSAQVLEPLRRGEPGCYQRYDWVLGRFAEWVPVPVPQVLLLEGCGAARRDCDPVASLRVWVQAPDDLRLARGLLRDGEGAREHWIAWMRDEADHFAAQDTLRRADVRLDAWGTMPT